MAHTFTTLLVLWITMVYCTEKRPIPHHLVECYRRPLPPLLPMTVETMTEIIRKISLDSFASLSVTQQISDILNWFSIDGLERSPNIVNMQNLVPYHRIGFEAHKQDLLFEKFIPIQRRVFEAYSLSLSEKCTLHLMVSASVDYWERGDESKSCPNSPQQFRKMTADGSGGAGMYSVCPLEGGVVLTPDGSVSVSRLLTALAAALTPQQIQLSQLLTPEQLIAHRVLPTDSISNIWAATIAGDLAEVAVEQTPLYGMDVTIGLPGRWNNTDIPSYRYFNNVPFTVIEKHQWQITDAEILGGIDGLLLGNMIQRLRNSASKSLRLSQVLEMYYSNWGGTGVDHACKRKSAFNALMRGNKKTLIEQTKRFAALLSMKTTNYLTENSIMAYRCVNAVERFMLYYPHLMVEGSCPVEDKTFPRLNLFVILDSTWPPYSSLRFLMSLTQQLDISYYGGSITVINGDSSVIRVNSTSNPTILYQQMRLDNNGTTLKNSNYTNPFLL